MANGKRSTSGRLQRRPRQRDPLPEPGTGSAAPRPTRKRVPGLRRATAEHAAPAAPGPCSGAGRTRNTRRRESVTSVLGRRREPPSWEGREPPQRPRPAQQQHPQSRLGRPDAAPDLSPATRKGFMRHQSESEVRASEGGTQHRPRREMPVTVGPHGQSQPNCFDRVKMGFMMGFAVGMAAGALFGTFSSLRIGMRGRELMGGIGKTMMQSGGTFGTFMAIGMGIRC